MNTDPRKNDSLFQESDRFGDPNCITEDGKDCAAIHVVYKITCNSYQQSVSNESKRSREPDKHEGENYIGMTMTSSNCRMISHLSGQRTKSIKNPLWRYDKDPHDGQHQQYAIMVRDKGVFPLIIVETLWIKSRYLRLPLMSFKEDQ